MCENATRILTWDTAVKVDLTPLMPPDANSDIVEGLTVKLRVHHITEAIDYQIFDALKQRNVSFVLDLIEERRGINAVDEWGFTPLMLSVKNSELVVVAALLNSRKPIVEVNAAKSVCSVLSVSFINHLTMFLYHFSVWFYSIVLCRGTEINDYYESITTKRGRP